MRHIKAKYKLSAPGTIPFDAYGWESIWTKKTAIVDGEAVSAGDIVSFQPITVQRDGKCLILATKANIKKIKAMLEKKQMTLAPGETLELPEVKQEAPAEEAWPEAPSVEANDSEPAEAVAVAPRAKRKVSKADLTPDVEG